MRLIKFKYPDKGKKLVIERVLVAQEDCTFDVAWDVFSQRIRFLPFLRYLRTFDNIADVKVWTNNRLWHTKELPVWKEWITTIRNYDKYESKGLPW